jgi:hypothetical protein
MELDKPPRDITISKEDREKYSWLSTKFNLDVKQVFLLAMKVGFFYGLKGKQKRPIQSIGQFSTLSDDDIKDMITIAFSELQDDAKIFDGKIVMGICEEYSTGGIRKLYGQFAGANKEDVKIIEDMLDEISGEVK